MKISKFLLASTYGNIICFGHVFCGGVYTLEIHDDKLLSKNNKREVFLNNKIAEVLCSKILFSKQIKAK